MIIIDQGCSVAHQEWNVEKTFHLSYAPVNSWSTTHSFTKIHSFLMLCKLENVTGQLGMSVCPRGWQRTSSHKNILFVYFFVLRKLCCLFFVHVRHCAKSYSENVVMVKMPRKIGAIRFAVNDRKHCTIYYINIKNHNIFFTIFLTMNLIPVQKINYKVERNIRPFWWYFDKICYKHSKVVINILEVSRNYENKRLIVVN